MKYLSWGAAAFFFFFGTPDGAMAEPLSPSPVFDSAVNPTAGHGAEPFRINIQSWHISGEGPAKTAAVTEIPLRGLYVAHLLSGALTAIIDGKSTNYMPGAYWTVKAGAPMQVKVSGDLAVLETIVVTKQ